MGSLDAMREAYGSDGLPADLAIIVVGAVGVCLLLSLVCMLREAAGRPDVWPAIAGGFGFWAVALSGRPMLAVALLGASGIATSYLGTLRQRRLDAEASRKHMSI